MSPADKVYGKYASIHPHQYFSVTAAARCKLAQHSITASSFTQAWCLPCIQYMTSCGRGCRGCTPHLPDCPLCPLQPLCCYITSQCKTWWRWRTKCRYLVTLLFLKNLMTLPRTSCLVTSKRKGYIHCVFLCKPKTFPPCHWDAFIHISMDKCYSDYFECVGPGRSVDISLDPIHRRTQS